MPQPNTNSEETRAGEAKPPAVSVVMPAYNVAPYIAETLDSVFSQTFTDYEVIVVNDGSPDSAELERTLEPYRGRIRYIEQENGGASAARNTALRAARGEFVAFLDADDVWEPDYLSRQMEFLRAGDYDLVYSNALIFGESPLAGKTYMETSPSDGEVTFKSLMRFECSVITSGVLARKLPILEAGLFNEQILSIGEDFELWLRLVRRGARVAYQRQVLLRYRCHPGSLSSTDPVSKLARQLILFEKIAETHDLSAEERAEIDYVFERLRAGKEFEMGKAQFVEGNFAEAHRRLKTANGFQRSWKVRAILLLMRLSPRLLRRLYLWRLGKLAGHGGKPGALGV